MDEEMDDGWTDKMCGWVNNIWTDGWLGGWMDK